MLVGLPNGVIAEVDFAQLAKAAPVSRVQETLGHAAGLGSRVVGYPGADEAARFIQANFRDIGLDDIAVHEYDVSIPMDKGGELTLPNTGEAVRLHGIWPNLVKTSTLPEGGLDARPVDAGKGDYAAMDGFEVEGAAVIMDFNSGDAWINAAYSGRVR